MDGVLSLAAPRKQLQTGTDPYKKIMDINPIFGATAKKYGTAYEAAMDEDQQVSRDDILANLLIRGGMSAVSGEGAGKGTLAGLATAYKKPTEEALAQLSAMKKTPQQARMLGVKSAIEADIARQKSKTGYESGTLDAKVKEYYANLARTSPTGTAVKEAYEVYPLIRKAIANDLPIIKAPVDQKSKRIDPRFFQGKPDGTVFIDPIELKFKMIVNGVPVRVNQDTLQPETAKK